MTHARRRAARLGWTLVAIAAIVLLSATTAGAVPKKLLFTSKFGWNVNLTKIEENAGQKERNICTLVSKDTCQSGQRTHEVGGFEYDFSAAVDPASGNVYVVDTNNYRIQEFSAGGEFVLTFGWNVNKTKVKEAAPQSERNVCAAASGDECGAGEAGTGAEQINAPQDIAIDPETHNLYVLESSPNHRIDEYTPQGVFVLMVGGNVDRTKVELGAPQSERNVCTAASGDTCDAGQFGPGEGALRGYPEGESGNLLTFGGPKHLLYFADLGHVQEIAPSGKWEGEIPIPVAEPTSVAVDPTGDVYVAANGGSIHKLDDTGTPIAGYEASEAGKLGGKVKALALDPSTGFLAAVIKSSGEQGSLYDGAGKRLSNFEPPGGMVEVHSLSFNAKDELYAAKPGDQEVEKYESVSVPEALTGSCENATAAAFTLTGLVNPENVAKTTAWFEYGTSEQALASSQTPHQPIPTGNAFVPFEATVTGLLPNENYYYRAAAEGEINPGTPEAGATLSCLTLPLPPRIEGPPESGFVTFSSAVLYGALDPENANTEYWFQYAAYKNETCEKLESCTSALQTARAQSSAYGVIGVVLSVTDLQPTTTYLYRLVAINHTKNGKEEPANPPGAEGAFTTAHAPSPTATTEPVGSVTTTSAVLNGSVNPDGAGATYAFQAGIYNGASTVYTTITQGPTGSEAQPIPESFTLTGLQPGTTYAYKIIVTSAYGTSEGTPVTFTTPGLATVVFAPPTPVMIPVPPIPFPEEPKKCARGYRHDKHGKCVRFKKKKTKGRRGKGAKKKKQKK